ncbi:MAG: hypothetical protein RIC19_02435 [Phaeodactylibacter sp.]|uniref:hypothetical protein n=1 Tax=Phaeodactylibacter sp. TaxID=1940289 RepID=UPI0032EFC167
MRFAELISLAKVVSRNKIKQVDVLGKTPVEHSNIEQLYRELQQDKYKTEEAASSAFFGKSRYRRHYFNRLKRKLREKLVNALFLIDLSQPGFSEYQRAYYSCYRYAAAVQILITGYSRKVAISLANMTLRKAVKYEFTDIILQMAKILRYHYGAMEGETKRFAEFDNLITVHQPIYQAELELEGKYTELVMYFNAPKSDKVDFYTKARAYAEMAEQRLSTHDSYKIFLYGFSIITIQHQIIYDHEQLVKSCDRAVAYFRKKQSRSASVALSTFSFKKIPSLIALKAFDEAEAVIQYCLGLTKKGRNNYFKVLEYAIMLYFHSQQYERALATLETAYNTEQFDWLPEQSLEAWRIYDAYLHLFYEIGLVSNRPSLKKSFRLNRLLNNVPKYSKDKRGANVTILTIHVLFLLQQGKHAEIIDRMEALKTYTHRYLRKDAHFRSNCFLNMLHKIPACSFNRKAVLRRTAHLRKRMNEVSFSETRQNLESEIVPYEHLWDIAVRLLH